MIGEAEQGAGVAFGDLARRQRFLHGGRCAEQANTVRDRRAILADALRHLLLRHAELGDERAVGECFLQWVEIGPLDILDQGEFEHLLRRGILDDDGHLPQPGAAGCLPAPLPGDDPVRRAVGEMASMSTSIPPPPSAPSGISAPRPRPNPPRFAPIPRPLALCVRSPRRQAASLPHRRAGERHLIHWASFIGKDGQVEGERRGRAAG